jgi:hypothetical protein
VDKLEEFSRRITIIPGATDDREVIERALPAGGQGSALLIRMRIPPVVRSSTSDGTRGHAGQVLIANARKRAGLRINGVRQLIRSRR